jgi:hypothetical protein
VKAIVSHTFKVDKLTPEKVELLKQDFQDMCIGRCLEKIGHKIYKPCRKSKTACDKGIMYDIPYNPYGPDYKEQKHAALDPLDCVPKGDV